MAPKLIKNLIILGSIFGSLFVEALELLGCLLGAVLGLLRLSWEASGPQKPEKTLGFLRFLQMQVFGYLKLLMALLGSSWPLLGPIWSQNGPQNGPRNCQKVVQKIVQNTTPTKIDLPQNGLSWRARGTGSGSRSYFKSSCFQDGPKMLQDGLK